MHALLGGLHLSGPAFEPIIDRTVDALTHMTPELVGARSLHRLARPARPSGSHARCLGRGQQRLVIPARRSLTRTTPEQ
jgi:hypothetical protein